MHTAKLTSLHQTLSQETRPEHRYTLLMEMAKTLEIISKRNDEQRKYIKDALHIALSLEDEDRAYHAYYMLSQWYYHNSDYGNASFYAEEAVAIAQRLEDIAKEFTSLRIIANIHSVLGNHQESVRLHTNLLRLEESEDNIQHLAIIYMNLGAGYIRLAQWKEAEEKTNKSIEYFRRLNLPDTPKYTMNAYENLSYIYSHLDSHNNEALEMAQVAMDVAKANELPMTNSGFMLLGRAYMKLSEYDLARHYLEQALLTDVGMAGDFWNGLIQQQFAELELTLEHYDEAETRLLTALTLFTRLNTKNEIIQVHYALYVLYKQRGNLKDALYHMEVRHMLSHQLVNYQIDALIQINNTRHEMETTRLQQQAELERLKRAEQELEQRKSTEKHTLELALERGKVRMLSEFIGNTSHDLRTPLSVIHTQTYLIRKLNDPARQEEALNKIEAHARQLNIAINGLQTMAKLDSELDGELMNVDLNAMLQSVLAEERPKILERAHHITLELQDGLPFVKGNLRYLRVAISELVTNAIIYTPSKGHILFKTFEAHGSVTFSVQDNGMGISEVDLPRIFDRFFKADDARRMNGSGTGLGLTMVKKIAEAYGGIIEVHSTLAQGSTFRLSFLI